MSAVIDYSVSPPVIRCPNCNDRQDVTLPMSVETLCRMANTFSARHEKCWIESQMRKGVRTFV